MFHLSGIDNYPGSRTKVEFISQHAKEVDHYHSSHNSCCIPDVHQNKKYKTKTLMDFLESSEDVTLRCLAKMKPTGSLVLQTYHLLIIHTLFAKPENSGLIIQFNILFFLL